MKEHHNSSIKEGGGLTVVDTAFSKQEHAVDTAVGFSVHTVVYGTVVVLRYELVSC